MGLGLGDDLIGLGEVWIGLEAFGLDWNRVGLGLGAFQLGKYGWVVIERRRFIIIYIKRMRSIIIIYII